MNGATPGDRAREERVQQLFQETLPARFRRYPLLAAAVRGRYKLTVSGAGGGEWLLDLTGEAAKVLPVTADEADCTIEMASDDLLTLLSNAVTFRDLAMDGRLVVGGRRADLCIFLPGILGIRGLQALDIEERFDETFGYDTAGAVEAWEHAEATPITVRRNTRYAPTPVSVIERCVSTNALGITDPSQFTFVDAGCGKGRVLLIACQQPFNAVVGIEYSRDLCRIARENLDRMPASRRACRDVRVVCADIAEFDPPNEHMVLFVYESFTKEVMLPFLARIERAMSHPRRLLRIVLVGTKLNDVVLTVPWLRVFRRIPCDRDRKLDATIFAND